MQDRLLPGEECPFMCNAMQCTEPYGHKSMHQAVHRPIPGVSAMDVKLAWDDMWIDPALQRFTSWWVLYLPGEDIKA